MSDSIDPFGAVSPIPEDATSGGRLSNVMPLRGDQRKLKPRAQYLLQNFRHAGDVQPQLDRPYLVKGWLDEGALSVLYGPSNTGKSFLALFIAHHVSKGRRIGRHRVKEGRVLYIAAEGGAAFDNRVAALDEPEIWVASCPMTLTGKDAQAGPLVEVIQHLTAVNGAPFALVILDTMARVMGGSDENAAPDIADLLKNLDMIRRATGSHIMLVHHTGKDQSRGARGHSSLRAAIDTEIELSRDDFGLVTANLTKQRDGATGLEFTFTLRQVELGRDQDGDPVTTCLVEPAEPSEDGRAVVTEAARKALSVLDKTLAEAGEIFRKPQYPGTACVPLERWRGACLEAGAISDAESREARSRTFLKCREQLVERRLIVVRDDLVWRVE